MVAMGPVRTSSVQKVLARRAPRRISRTAVDWCAQHCNRHASVDASRRRLRSRMSGGLRITKRSSRLADQVLADKVLVERYAEARAIRRNHPTIDGLDFLVRQLVP
jgi:hypothetical protein